MSLLGNRDITTNGTHYRDDDEFEVANTLIDLQFSFTKPLSYYRFYHSWCKKRKRSCLVSQP